MRNSEWIVGSVNLLIHVGVLADVISDNNIVRIYNKDAQ